MLPDVQRWTTSRRQWKTRVKIDKKVELPGNDKEFARSL